MSFHINKNGEPAKCHATVKDCPLGGEHFDSQREAMESLNALDTRPDVLDGLTNEQKNRFRPLEDFSLEELRELRLDTNVDREALERLIADRVRERQAILEHHTMTFIDARGGLDEQGHWRSFQPFTLLKTQEVLAEYNLTLDHYERWGQVDQLDLYEDMEGYSNDPWNELPTDLREGWRKEFQRVSDHRDKVIASLNEAFGDIPTDLKKFSKDKDGYEIGVAVGDNDKPVRVAVHTDGSVYNLQPHVASLAGSRPIDEHYVKVEVNQVFVRGNALTYGDSDFYFQPAATDTHAMARHFREQSGRKGVGLDRFTPEVEGEVVAVFKDERGGYQYDLLVVSRTDKGLKTTGYQPLDDEGVEAYEPNDHLRGELERVTRNWMACQKETGES